MTFTDSKRLADIRSQLIRFSVLGVSVETWDADFLLRMIDEKNQQIEALWKLTEGTHL